MLYYIDIDSKLSNFSMDFLQRRDDVGCGHRQIYMSDWKSTIFRRI